MLIKEVGHLLYMIPMYTTACFGDKAFPQIQRIPDEDYMGALMSDKRNDRWLQCTILINTKDYDIDECMKDIELFEQFYYNEGCHSLSAQDKIFLFFDFI